VTVTVRLFAYYAEHVGRTEWSLELPEGATVSDVVASVTALPGGSVIPDSPLAAVNQSYAKGSMKLTDGDEVAIIPPVAGG
jgi:MoaE-MoaD fusion protein